MGFINREKELNFLQEKWAEKRSQLMIIYGKRRVGKTELIKHFLKGKPAVYFLGDRRSSSEQLKELGALVGGHFGDSILAERGFSGWLEVFRYLGQKIESPFVLVVDEYPYLVESDKSVSSVFQKGWDEYLKDKPVFLILCGSSVAMMESEALVYKAPLYGRRTGQLLLKPLSFEDSRRFFPRKSFSEFLEIFTVAGGLPAYLLRMDTESPLEANIKKRVFPPGEFLHNEMEFILKEELREPRNYLSILKAVSLGKRKFGEIANETGLEKNVLTKYLNVLERLLLLEKEVPVTEENPAKSKKGLYRVDDNFARFWFRYVFPYKSELEIGLFDGVLAKFRESFPMLESQVYERICADISWKHRDRIFPFRKLGRWWDKNTEIDIVGLNSETGQILFGEAKWTNKPVGFDVYQQLRSKAAAVNWGAPDRREYYALFSKSGFTEELKNIAEKEPLFLFHQDKLQ
ncbi:MAG: ATP-binding protein [bacterium]